MKDVLKSEFQNSSRRVPKVHVNFNHFRTRQINVFKTLHQLFRQTMFSIPWIVVLSTVELWHERMFLTIIKHLFHTRKMFHQKKSHQSQKWKRTRKEVFFFVSYGWEKYYYIFYDTCLHINLFMTCMSKLD